MVWGGARRASLRAQSAFNPPSQMAAASAKLRLAGLSANLLSCLVLFDVLEPVDDSFAWRDLVAAREAARLLKRGVALRDVLDASLALRRRGSHLAEARLTEGPSGELVREIAGQLAELSGQFTMHLEQKAHSLDDLLVEAEQAEDAGDLATAESLYTTAMRADVAGRPYGELLLRSERNQPNRPQRPGLDHGSGQL